MKQALKVTIAATIAVICTGVKIDLPPTQFEKLGIDVSCQGIDYDGLSSKALAFSAKTLEDTFKTAHKGTTADDGWTLFHVSSTVPLSKTTNNLRGKDTLSFAAKVPMITAGDLGGDDFKCRLCDKDDAAAALVDASKLRIWEIMFASVISTSPFDALKKASKCNIKLSSNDADFVGPETMVPLPVDVDLKCENIDFSELPIKAMTYATKSLQETYDSIHSAIDSSKMTNVVLSGHRVRVGDLGGDDFQCNLCGSDSEFEAWDSVTFSAKTFVSGEDLGGDDFKCRLCGSNERLDASEREMLKAWEGIFLARLLNDPNGDFKTTKHCSISITEKSEDIMA